jgi:hypothetical protein
VNLPDFITGKSKDLKGNIAGQSEKQIARFVLDARFFHGATRQLIPQRFYRANWFRKSVDLLMVEAAQPLFTVPNKAPISSLEYRSLRKTY